MFAPDIWASPTHWDVALLALVAIVLAVAVNVASVKAAGLKELPRPLASLAGAADSAFV